MYLKCVSRFACRPCKFGLKIGRSAEDALFALEPGDEQAGFLQFNEIVTGGHTGDAVAGLVAGESVDGARVT